MVAASSKATARDCFLIGVSSSMGMASGVPVPRATGDTLSDCSAETVQASISIAPLVTGVDGERRFCGMLASSSGGGTAL